MVEPKVSVIVPTYNCDRYILQAVHSILAQEHCSYEVVVIDDGSTDNTSQVLEPLKAQIRYVIQTNGGVAAARNHGVKIANGELIAFLDADDYFLPGKLAAQVNVFGHQPRLGIVHSGWRRVDLEGNPLLDICPWEYVPELTLENWLMWKPVLPSAMMFRREWLMRVGGFDSRFPPAEDVDLILKLAYRGCQAAWLRQVTVCYRQHPDSAMHQGLPQARSLHRVLNNFFQQSDLPESVRLIEHEVRYGTKVWLAWYLYHTGHYREMAEHLQQAWQYLPSPPVQTLVRWVESFAQFAHNWGYDFDAHHLGSLKQWQQLAQWMIHNSAVESEK